MGIKRAAFGKASKEKRTKPQTEEEVKPEIEIEIDGDVDDEELSEVYGLFAKLQSERDPKIARGLIHECDRLLRERDEKDLTLPSKFHVVYAGSLLSLADPAIIDNQADEFRAAGLERIAIGLESLEEDTESAIVSGIAAQEIIQFLHTQIEEGKVKTESKSWLSKAVDLIKSKTVNSEIAKAAFKFVQLLEDLNPVDETDDVIDVLKTHKESDDDATKSWANCALGTFYLNKAAQSDSSAESVDDINKDILNQAITHLRDGLNDENTQSFVMLAEGLLQLAGVIEEEEDSTEDVGEVYSEALRHLKKAQLLGHEDLREIIESLEE